jgi:hypothetical protein
MGKQSTKNISVGLSAAQRFRLDVMVTSPWLLISRPPRKAATTALTAITRTVDDGEERGRAAAATAAALDATWLGLQIGLCSLIGYVAQAVGLAGTSEAGKSFICSLAVVVVPFSDYMTGRALAQREWVRDWLGMVSPWWDLAMDYFLVAVVVLLLLAVVLLRVLLLVLVWMIGLACCNHWPLEWDFLAWNRP